MMSRKHTLMLTARNLAPWVFFGSLYGGTPERVQNLGVELRKRMSLLF